MPVSRASIELLAVQDDVWAFVSEPYSFADWWPGIATVEPDRRGFAAGARWRVRRREASLFRRAEAEDTLLVSAVDPPSRFAFELARAKVRATLVLVPHGPDRTRAELRAQEPFTLSFTRGRLAKDALARLYDLVQTSAAL
ncbi:MAG TPA: SRPBCC family protein [Gaiellaceae bacterium]|nr:SRPBCC family protein [Gaiellaceae bacterium]